MTERLHESRTAGLLGPVALSGGLLLLLLAPLMRGGNRHAALIPLELLGLLVVLALWGRWTVQQPAGMRAALARPLLPLMVLSPLLLALVQLVPLPTSWWAATPGRALYLDTLAAAGVPLAASSALSIAPDATAASLLAGVPVAAAFLLGYVASIAQLQLLVRVVAALAFGQVLLALLQVAGGQHSPLFFGVMSYGPPVGSFANRNHFANYLVMALCAYIWLAYEAHRASRGRSPHVSFGYRHRMALWAAGAFVLVLGILISRSRGAALFGLPVAAIALAVVSLRVRGWSKGWRFALPMLVAVVLGALALAGFGSVIARISLEQLSASAGFRSELARTSLDGALAFWPWGAGWGTYDVAYPRFQPGSIAGFANHAHMDYVEMLLEGGIFFVLLAAAFLWLALGRAATLVQAARRGRTLGREAMAASLCGLGLLALLLHSLVEFNLRIPANAMLGALLAGVFLRPLAASREAA